MRPEITIRPYEDRDANQVRELFVTVNRLLSPPDMREAFEGYIARSLIEEMDRVWAYYNERGGAFWVACQDSDIVGMFGLEPFDDRSYELRRMYVRPHSSTIGHCVGHAPIRRRGMPMQGNSADGVEHIRTPTGGHGVISSRRIQVGAGSLRRTGKQ